MTWYEKLLDRYKKGWATKEQLQQYVKLNIITATEYQLITGEQHPTQ